MSGYPSRRTPGGVSQYIQGLNTLPSAYDLSASDLPALDDGGLDFLAHAQFIDFDFDPNNPNNVEFNNHSPSGDHTKHANVAAVNGSGFQFGEFQTYPPTVGSTPTNDGLNGAFAQQPQQHHLGFGPQPGEKRKASMTTSLPSAADLEEQSRMAAEEDKRRRNTAASARFRVKKKQREQALEKQAKDMTDKVTQLEGRVQQLEMENKWLKGLITDKGDGKTLESLQREKESEERKADDKTDGVGTEADVEDADEVKAEV